MPLRKRLNVSSRSTKRTRYAKKTKMWTKSPRIRRTVRNRVSVNIGKNFPKRLVFTHKYVGQATLSLVSGAIGIHRYSCNSLYDPDQTGVGHQPSYFDTLAGLYNYYTVIGSRVSAIITYKDVDLALQPVVCGIRIADDTATVASNTTEFAENSTARQYILTQANGRVKLTSKWSARKFFGGSVLANDNLQGTPLTSPSEQSYWNIFCQPMDQASTVGVFVRFYVQYIAVWDELKPMVQS